MGLTRMCYFLYSILSCDKLVHRRHRKEKHSDTCNRDKEYKKLLKSTRLTEENNVSKNEPAATQRGIRKTASFNIVFGPKR